MSDGQVDIGQLSIFTELDDSLGDTQILLPSGHPVIHVKRVSKAAMKHMGQYRALAVSVDNRLTASIERNKRIAQQRSIYPRNLQHTVLPVVPSLAIARKIVLTDNEDVSSMLLPSHAPTRAIFTAFDFAVLMAIYSHLICKNCITVFSLREVYRSMSHKTGNVALLSEKNSRDIEESIKKLTKSYVAVRIGRRQECLSLLPAEIRTERIFGAMTRAVCLRECPPFLIFAIEYGWLAIDRVPFSFHQHMQATRRQISISFIIDCIIADALEKMDVADDSDVQVEIPYTIIYNAANDEAVHRLPKKKSYSPTYCNRVRKVVRGLLDELKDLGIVAEWEEYKGEDGTFERAIATITR